MAKYLVVANWKTNPNSLLEARAIFKRTLKSAQRLSKTEVVIAPPFPLISSFKKSKKIKLGAQDTSFEVSGPFTGEVSPHLLRDLGVDYVIVGHSERRSAGETDELISKKIKSAVNARLTPILCVGEAERDYHGEYLRFLTHQIKASLRSVKKEEASKVVIAYEPVWAIGKKSSNAIDPRALHESVLYVRKVIADTFGRKVAEKIKVIYGGSVKEDNVEDLIIKGGVSGFLVGSASLTPGFSNILKLVELSK